MGTRPRAGAAHTHAMSPQARFVSEPFTERVSPHAHLLESDGARGVIRALSACDRELLDETHASHRGLTHIGTLGAVSDLAEAVADCVRVGLDPPPASASADPPACARVFLVGAGTSGRVCFLAARAANETLARLGHPDPNLFHHVVAGAPAALFRASESVEDSRDAAARDLRRVVRGSLAGDDASSPASALSRVVVVGVSCGFSAAYVAEALERALDDGEGLFRGARVDVTCVGFNHPSSARPDFHRVMTALRGSARGERVLINPILGPEALAGSTRMKGGTATKLVLDAAFAAAAVSACASRPNPHGAQSRVRATIDRLVRRAFDAGGAATAAASASVAERNAEGLGVIMTKVASCLARGGRAHYVAANRDGSNVEDVEDAAPESSRAREPESASRCSRAPSHVACLGAVDAAEQYPTFGTKPERFRGWGGDGWAASAGVSDSEFSYDAFVSRRRDPDVPEVAVALFECPRKGTNAREAKAETNGTETETMFAGTTCVGRVCARADPDAYDAPPWASSGRPGDVFIDVPWEAEETETETETETDGTEADGTEAKDADGTEAKDADGTEAKDANAREDTTFREIFAPRVAELAMKHAVNAVSTGAHVLLGKTLDGRMIDLRVGNEKLFRRAVDSVRVLAHDCSLAQAHFALVRAMHGEAWPGGTAAGAMTVRQHVEAAARRGAERVVPIAAWMATGLSFEDARRADQERLREYGRCIREGGEGGGEECDAKGAKRARTS